LQIQLEELTNKIENQDYLQDLVSVKYADFNKSKSSIQKYSEHMVNEVVTALKHNSLIQTQVAVSGQRPVTFSLETNIINLPYHNYKKIANFFEADQAYPVQVYFETSSEYVNRSAFRIDLLASEAEIEADPAAVSAKLTTAIQEKMKTIRSYQKPAKAKAKTTSKTKTKKTSKTKSKK
jgi:hypothetical protein